MIGKVMSAATVGFNGRLIEVECDITKGLPTLNIVGLGNKAIDEAKERVRSAMRNSNLDFPTSRITINLAPASIPKDGASFDLPIALAVMVANGHIKPHEVKSVLCVGELALDGTLRPIRGAISVAETAKSHKFTTLIVPKSNALQASAIKGVVVIGASDLREVFLHLKKEKVLAPTLAPQTTATIPNTPAATSGIDIADIHGQDSAKRALLIAAAGHHNILFDGPPGAGKTMLAKALLGILPPLEIDEIIEVTKLHSLAGESEEKLVRDRPFRSPHHSASHISLIGGGQRPTPGEISLAHRGVLFLDEIPEFPRLSLESLRQPLEDNIVHISRAAERASYPADFMLVATQNPCPCGYAGDPVRECHCSPNEIDRYQKRLSGPLMDRIDMVISVARVEHDKLLQPAKEKLSAKLQTQVALARHRQAERYGRLAINNSRITPRDIQKYLTLTTEANSLLNTAAKTLELSARAYFKIIKVAQTIADLETSEVVDSAHIQEALQYRPRKSA